MDTDDAADISWQVLAAECWRQVFFGVLPPKGDDRVTVELIQAWAFLEQATLLIFLHEELREGLLLDLVDFVHVEPLG